MDKIDLQYAPSEQFPTFGWMQSRFGTRLIHKSNCGNHIVVQRRDCVWELYSATPGARKTNPRVRTSFGRFYLNTRRYDFQSDDPKVTAKHVTDMVQIESADLTQALKLI